MARLSQLRIDGRDVKIGEQIADWSGCDVFKGTYKGRCVAVCVPAADGWVADDRDLFSQLQNYSRMNHAGILQLIGLDWREVHHPVVLTPLMSNGTIADLLEKERKGMADPRWDATKKSICVFGVAAAMAYAHSKGIHHPGLNPAKVFLNDQLEPVIGGFLATRLDPDLVAYHEGPTYMAPELWADGEPRYAADVYAYAVFLFRMFSDSKTLCGGRGAEQNPFEWERLVHQGFRLLRPGDVIPDFYWELITYCWDQDPWRRPTFVQIVKEFRKNRESYAFPGTDLGALEEYEGRILEGVELDDDDVL